MNFDKATPGEILKALDTESGIPALLQKAITLELSAIIQYMWQHVTVTGLYADSLAGVFASISKTEMSHVEKIADRLNYLTGADPTVEVAPITLGSDAIGMLQNNVAAELAAIDIYKQIIAAAELIGDETTEFIAQEILEDEEDHHNQFLTLLGQKGGVQ